MKQILRSSLIILVAFSGALSVHAATGTIDATHKYAWSDTGGYVNFKPTNGGLTITDTGITGYAWSAYNGWINFNPANGGVDNTPSGELSGHAWSERSGWISFTGVTIDVDGHFHGEATGANETITFDCTNCDVRTSWLPSADIEVENSGYDTSHRDGQSQGGPGSFGEDMPQAPYPGTLPSSDGPRVSLWNPGTWFPSAPGQNQPLVGPDAGTTTPGSEPFSDTGMLLPLLIGLGVLAGIGGLLFVLWRFVLPR